MEKTKEFHFNNTGRIIGAVVTKILLVLFALIVILPIAWVIFSSLKTSNDIESNPFWITQGLHFENYAHAWKVANMGKYFINSIIMTIVSLFLLLLFSVPTAYALSRFKNWWLKIFFYLFMAGLFVNMNYIVTPLYIMISRISRQILGNNGLVNNQFTVMLIYAVTNFSFTIYLLVGYFKGLPKDFEEAAKVDGCGKFRMLLVICVPLAMPSIVTVIMFNFLGFWNEYLVAMTFLSEEYRTLPAGLQAILRQSKSANDLGRMYAGLVIAMVPVLIVYSFVQGQLTKGVTLGGVKG